MDGIVEAKVKGYLRQQLNVNPYDCGAIVAKIRELAQAAGHSLDHRFGGSGLGSGPEGRVASAIVERALGGGGAATAEKDIKIAIERWVRNSPPKGM